MEKLYLPETGSLAYRVLHWYIDNPLEELSFSDIALKFDVAATRNVRGHIAEALKLGILQSVPRDGGANAVVTGPSFGPWYAAYASHNNRAAQRISATPPARKTKTVAPPLPDVDSIPLRVGVSHPKFGRNSRDDGLSLGRQMTALLARLRPGTSVVLDAIYLPTARETLTKYRKAHPDKNISIVTEGAKHISINYYPDTAHRRTGKTA